MSVTFIGMEYLNSGLDLFRKMDGSRGENPKKNPKTAAAGSGEKNCIIGCAQKTIVSSYFASLSDLRGMSLVTGAPSTSSVLDLPSGG